MKVTTKLIAGYLLIAFMIVISSGAGYRGVNELSSLLDFVTCPAWNTADGAMEGSIGIEAQMLAVERIIGVTGNTGKTKELMSEGIEMEDEALGRLVEAKLMTDEQFMTELKRLRQTAMYYANKKAKGANYGELARSVSDITKTERLLGDQSTDNVVYKVI